MYCLCRLTDYMCILNFISTVCTIHLKRDFRVSRIKVFPSRKHKSILPQPGPEQWWHIYTRCCCCKASFHSVTKVETVAATQCSPVPSEMPAALDGLAGVRAANWPETQPEIFGFSEVPIFFTKSDLISLPKQQFTKMFT